MTNYNAAFFRKKQLRCDNRTVLSLLSFEDAQEVVKNMIGLFSFLMELGKKYGKEEKKIQS